MIEMNMIAGKTATFSVRWDDKTMVLPTSCEIRAQCLGERTLGFARFFSGDREMDTKRCCMHCAAAEVFRLAGYP